MRRALCAGTISSHARNSDNGAVCVTAGRARLLDLWRKSWWRRECAALPRLQRLIVRTRFEIVKCADQKGNKVGLQRGRISSRHSAYGKHHLGVHRVGIGSEPAARRKRPEMENALDALESSRSKISHIKQGALQRAYELESGRCGRKYLLLLGTSLLCCLEVTRERVSTC